MSFFSFGGGNDRYGITLDIGSGSVLAAIVHSAKADEHPTIIWAHREHTALKKIDSIEQSAKAVLAALMNTSLKLDSEGRQALRAYDPGAKLTKLQCSIAAPWSYTVTKTVNIKQDEPIEITDDLIEELVSSAQKQVEEELQEHSKSSELGLDIVAKATMDMLSNGYRVRDPDGEKAKTLNLTQATVVAQQYLTTGLSEMQNKLFPNTTLEKVSFILMLYCTVRHLHPHTDDVCLVDITDEATEIGIVRDGSLKYSTHIPFGIFSLAREIADVTGVPLHDALSQLKSEDLSTLLNKATPAKLTDIEQIFASYQIKVAELLNETGDSLSIPKRLILHTDTFFESLFSELIAQAARDATKIEHTVVSVAKEIIPVKHKKALQEHIGDNTHDTALLLAAEFFHKQKHCLDFKYS